LADDALKRGLEILQSVQTVQLADDTGHYEQILHGLLSDLESPDTLSVILCEQIAECLYWLRKHVEDKELILLEATAQKIDKAISRFGDRKTPAEDIRKVIRGDKKLKADFDQRIADSRDNKVAASFDGCRAVAFEASVKAIKTADDLIQRQLLNIRHLQKSLDNIDMKRRLMKRMDLELYRLEQDINTLEHEPETNKGQ
jgi:hypothetical protein